MAPRRRPLSAPTTPRPSGILLLALVCLSALVQSPVVSARPLLGARAGKTLLENTNNVEVNLLQNGPNPYPARVSAGGSLLDIPGLLKALTIDGPLSPLAPLVKSLTAVLSKPRAALPLPATILATITATLDDLLTKPEELGAWAPFCTDLKPLLTDYLPSLDPTSDYFEARPFLTKFLTLLIEKAPLKAYSATLIACRKLILDQPVSVAFNLKKFLDGALSLVINSEAVQASFKLAGGKLVTIKGALVALKVIIGQIPEKGPINWWPLLNKVLLLLKVPTELKPLRPLFTGLHRVTSQYALAPTGRVLNLIPTLIDGILTTLKIAKLPFLAKCQPLINWAQPQFAAHPKSAPFAYLPFLDRLLGLLQLSPDLLRLKPYISAVQYLVQTKTLGRLLDTRGLLGPVLGALAKEPAFAYERGLISGILSLVTGSDKPLAPVALIAKIPGVALADEATRPLVDFLKGIAIRVTSLIGGGIDVELGASPSGVGILRSLHKYLVARPGLPKVVTDLLPTLDELINTQPEYVPLEELPLFANLKSLLSLRLSKDLLLPLTKGNILQAVTIITNVLVGKLTAISDLKIPFLDPLRPALYAVVRILSSAKSIKGGLFNLPAFLSAAVSELAPLPYFKHLTSILYPLSGAFAAAKEGEPIPLSPIVSGLASFLANIPGLKKFLLPLLPNIEAMCAKIPAVPLFAIGGWFKSLYGFLALKLKLTGLFGPLLLPIFAKVTGVVKFAVSIVLKAGSSGLLG